MTCAHCDQKAEWLWRDADGNEQREIWQLYTCHTWPNAAQLLLSKCETQSILKGILRSGGKGIPRNGLLPSPKCLSLRLAVCNVSNAIKSFASLRRHYPNGSILPDRPSCSQFQTALLSQVHSASAYLRNILLDRYISVKGNRLDNILLSGILFHSCHSLRSNRKASSATDARTSGYHARVQSANLGCALRANPPIGTRPGSTSAKRYNQALSKSLAERQGVEPTAGLACRPIGVLQTPRCQHHGASPLKAASGEYVSKRLAPHSQFKYQLFFPSILHFNHGAYHLVYTQVTLCWRRLCQTLFQRSHEVYYGLHFPAIFNRPSFALRSHNFILFSKTFQSVVSVDEQDFGIGLRIIFEHDLTNFRCGKCSHRIGFQNGAHSVGESALHIGRHRRRLQDWPLRFLSQNLQCPKCGLQVLKSPLQSLLGVKQSFKFLPDRYGHLQVVSHRRKVNTPWVQTQLKKC